MSALVQCVFMARSANAEEENVFLFLKHFRGVLTDLVVQLTDHQYNQFHSLSVWLVSGALTVESHR